MVGRLAVGLRAAAVVLSVCVLSQGFLPLGRFSGSVETLTPGQGDPWANALQLLVLAAVLISTAVSFRAVRPTLRAGLAQWPIWTYCLASTIWSASPGTTFRRSILLLTYFVFGHFAYAIAGTRGTVRLLNVASWIMIVCSLVLFVAVPSIGQDIGSYEGALRGVFSQKNVTAWTFQLALAYLGYRLYADRRVGPGFLLGVAIIIGGIVLTRSTTELLACVLLIAFWAWSAWFRSSRLKLLPLWAAAAMLAVAGFGLWILGDNAFQLLGKDAGLTGRGPIWDMAERAIAMRPSLGWGFQGFWLPDVRAVQEIWTVLTWPAPHAHNGWLELVIETGYVGAALYALVLGNLFVLVLRGLARDAPEAWWTLSWLILMVFKAHAEPVYLQLDMSTALISFSTVVLGMQQQAYARTRASSSATATRTGLGWSASS